MSYKFDAKVIIKSFLRKQRLGEVTKKPKCFYIWIYRENSGKVTSLWAGQRKIRFISMGSVWTEFSQLWFPSEEWSSFLVERVYLSQQSLDFLTAESNRKIQMLLCLLFLNCLLLILKWAAFAVSCFTCFSVALHHYELWKL